IRANTIAHQSTMRWLRSDMTLRRVDMTLSVFSVWTGWAGVSICAGRDSVEPRRAGVRGPASAGHEGGDDQEHRERDDAEGDVLPGPEAIAVVVDGDRPPERHHRGEDRPDRDALTDHRAPAQQLCTPSHGQHEQGERRASLVERVV